MVNYQLGKIYKIVCNTTGLVYIGSTCEPTLARRLAGHVLSYKRFLNDKYDFTTSFKILENSNYEIILLENFPCESKDELRARERWYIENTECVNRNIPNRNAKEYRDENKEKIHMVNKAYYEANNSKLKEHQKAYYASNKDKVIEYQKSYRETNREKINERQRAYNAANKEKLKEYFKKHREREGYKEKMKEYLKAYRAAKRQQQSTTPSPTL